MATSREKIKARRRAKIITGSIFAVIALGVIAIFVFSPKQETNDPIPSQSEALVPATANSAGAFHITNEGVVPVDSSNVSDIRLDMFFDPMCPGCGAVDRTLSGAIDKLVSDKEIDFYATPVSFLDRASSDNYSTRAVNALITVAENDPKNFLNFMSALYVTQPSEGADYVSVSDENLGTIAQSVGVPESVTSLFSKHSYFNWISESTKKQSDRTDIFPKKLSTPTLIFNYKEDTGEFIPVDFSSGEIEQPFNDALSKARGE